MKRCPNCGSENSDESTVCGNCRADFAPGQNDDIVMKGQPLGGPMVGGPADLGGPVSQVGRPIIVPDEPVEKPHTPAAPYRDATGPPRLHYVERPEKPKARWSPDIWGFLYTLITLAVVFGGGGYAINEFYLKPAGPMNATRSFMGAIVSGDTVRLRDSLNSTSRVWYDSLGSQQRDVFNYFHNTGQGWAEGTQYKLKFWKSSGNYAKVLVKPGPVPLENFKDESLPASFSDGVPITLVKDGKNGDWRVDLVSSYKARAKVGF